ncbi:putative DNA-binding protein [Mobilicoccus pelagius NBRC 104925]|uniref:Putative DNA-binding protein n=1 Tax=Mobilicoccus pelagius NBRC 104925 TaxID=1089455 RepID=H5UTM9_9MICO|nr:putative DNA-binding protein [Mobilicoccus pelagius NBRC 104925]
MFIEGRTSAASRSRVSTDGDARTRDVVLRRVSELGPVTAARLAEVLAITTAGVRRHLEALAQDGLIATSDVTPAKRGRGRPARAFVVTPEGHNRLSTGYGDVATDALQFLADRLGQDAVADFARARLAVLEGRYAPVVEAAGEDLDARAQALATALAADGYAASARPVGPSGLGLQLCQGHCPMPEVATRFPQFCEEETEVFARLLGVHVQRLATLAGGEHVCTTFVPREPVVLGTPGRAPASTAAPPPASTRTTPTGTTRTSTRHTSTNTDHCAHGHDEGSAT